MRIVLIPGMGCSPVTHSNWYSWFENKVSKLEGVEECIIRDFPDPNKCREKIWVPYLINEIGLDENTVVVGHSTGASCAMRLLESHSVPKMKGVILVAAAYTDLGDEQERQSGYFDRPWDWEQMKDGANKIVCFHGVDDPLIPVGEARYIAENMAGENFEYHEMEGVSHFFQPWDNILDVIDDMICNKSSGER